MNIQMRLDPEIFEAAKKAASAEGVTLSEYLRKILKANLEPGSSPGDAEGCEEQDS
jgi:predicted DNA binding CopG/RHH family protein